MVFLVILKKIFLNMSSEIIQFPKIIKIIKLTQLNPAKREFRFAKLFNRVNKIWNENIEKKEELKIEETKTKKHKNKNRAKRSICPIFYDNYYFRHFWFFGRSFFC